MVHNHIPLDPVPVVPPLGLTVEKTASVKVARRGDVVAYQIRVRNPNAAAAGPLDVVDQLPAGFAYTPGSSLVAGLPLEPAVADRTLTYAALTVPRHWRADHHAQCARRPQTPRPETMSTLPSAIDPATGDALGTTGRASVRIEMEHVFDCGDVIGKVFDDRNRNGYQDEGEPGLPGVRVATVKGVLITTDKHGRFNVPCAELPDADIGSNFLLKLDTRTLPTGYRLDDRKSARGAADGGQGRPSSILARPSPKLCASTCRDKAFEPGSNQPSQALLAGIDTAAGQHGGRTRRCSGSPTLRTAATSGLASARLKAVEAAVQKNGARRAGARLTIETRVVAAK